MALQLNLPNSLTLLRVLAVPVVVFALLQETDAWNTTAAVAFGVAAATDYVDGWLARSRGQVTTFGKLMDPLADKLLIACTLVTLSGQGRLAWWVTVVVLAREFAVTALRARAADDGRVISASRWGKLKTVVQMVTVMCVIVAAPAEWVDWLVYAMVAVTLMTGFDYFVNTERRVDAADNPA